MATRVISSDERQSRRTQMSVAQRVTRRFRTAVRRVLHSVPAAAAHYAISPRARNAACVTFATGCCGRTSPSAGVVIGVGALLTPQRFLTQPLA